MMNRKLIKALKKERRRLYPHGPPIQARGCGKTFLHLSHILKYIAYDIVCDRYKHMDREVTLEEAHNDMNSFICEMWQEIESR